MRRRELIRAFAALAAASLAPLAFAQDKVRRVGWLGPGDTKAGRAFRKAFVEELAALGWREKRNLAIVERYADYRLNELPRLAAELVAAGTEVILCPGPSPALALKGLGTQVPGVFAGVADAVALGLAKTLSHPGGNFTGMATMSPDLLFSKQIELLREFVPHASRIAVITNPDNPMHVQAHEASLKLMRDQGLEVVDLPANSRARIDSAFAAAVQQKADILYVAGDPQLFALREFIATLALKHRLPSMFLFSAHVESGGLMSYGTDLTDLYRRAAGLVDKILRGARPGDLPIEEPASYLLVINLKTAKALGLTIPISLRLRADRVIE